MGQAKQRGTQKWRIEQAVEKIKELRPENLVCGECETRFPDFETMDTRGVPGIEAGYKGRCPACGRTVLALKGDADAIAAIMGPEMAEHERDAKLGSQSLQDP